MNLATVWPYPASRARAYLVSVVAMSCSHAVGAYVTYLTFVSRDAEDSTAFFALFAVAACGLMYLRQVLNWRNYCIVSAQAAAEAKKGA